jgi:hypothetical protein
MKFKALFLLFLFLNSCSSSERRLRKSYYSMKQGGCRTLIPNDRDTKQKLITLNGWIFCNENIQGDNTISDQTESNSLYLFNTKSYKRSQVTKIMFENNVWEVVSEAMHKNITFKLETISLFYQIAYDLFFMKGKSSLRDKNLPVELINDFKHLVGTLLKMSDLIKYLKAIEDWHKLITIIDLTPLTQETNLDLEFLGKNLNTNVLTNILDKVVDNKNPQLYKLSKLLIENPHLLAYLKDDIYEDLICLKLAETNGNEDIFVQTLRDYKVTDFQTLFEILDRFREDIKTHFALKVGKRVEYKEGNEFTIDVLNEFYNQQKAFDIFKIFPDLQDNIKKLFNFTGRKNGNPKYTESKPKDLNIASDFQKFYNEIGKCSNIHKIQAIIKTGDYEASKKLMKAFNSHSIQQDIMLLKQMEIENFNNFLDSWKSWKQVSEQGKLTDDKMFLNPDSKTLILSIFKGLPNSKINPFLNTVHSRLDDLIKFMSFNDSNTDILSNINGLMEFVNPFIIAINVSLNRKIEELNSEINRLSCFFKNIFIELKDYLKYATGINFDSGNKDPAKKALLKSNSAADVLNKISPKQFTKHIEDEFLTQFQIFIVRVDYLLSSIESLKDTIIDNEIVLNQKIDLKPLLIEIPKIYENDTMKTFKRRFSTMRRSFSSMEEWTVDEMYRLTKFVEDSNKTIMNFKLLLDRIKKTEIFLIQT